MGIFTNNITPTVPKDISWNNVCYDIFARELYKRLHAETWWDYVSGQRVNIDDIESGHVSLLSQNELKRKFQNMRRLPKVYQEALQNTIDRVYSKYGVWAKWKIQMGKNGRIKSIYFVKFC